MQNIYFTVMHDEFEDGEKLDWAIVVEKEFWDQYKELDDTMDKNLEDAFAGLVSLDGPENVSWEHDYISIDAFLSLRPLPIPPPEVQRTAQPRGSAYQSRTRRL